MLMQTLKLNPVFTGDISGSITALCSVKTGPDIIMFRLMPISAYVNSNQRSSSVLFIMLYKVILTFESKLKCDHSDESY